MTFPLTVGFKWADEGRKQVQSVKHAGFFVHNSHTTGNPRKTGYNLSNIVI